MKKIIIANWKDNLVATKSLTLAQKYKTIKICDCLKAVVCPDFSAISSVASIFKKTALQLGAQNCSALPIGAHTGEVSVEILKSLGVKYVIVGHSERRACGESDEVVSQKASKVLAAKMLPVVCVGETALERRSGNTLLTLERQIRGALGKLPKNLKSARIILAYEPVWEIGSGKMLAASEAEETCLIIKNFAKKCGALKVEVIFGGSINKNNSQEYLNKKNIDGLLVGGASLDFKNFSQIVNC
ncbi:MAG: triose-phosphate isomerase [Candidatus Falkowbacteria bacterium]|nr:triose-phosphate isomerase [Candidatus Falkowbacteria bacterium]